MEKINLGWIFFSNNNNRKGISSKNNLIKDIEFSGKWMVFGDENKLKNIYDNLKNEDILAFKRTNPEHKHINPMFKKNNSGVLCVYTYDYRDIEDCIRVLDILKKNGIKETLYYKRDFATISGRYSSPKDKVSTYNSNTIYDII